MVVGHDDCGGLLLLEEDILIIVLSKLQVKTLLRFRSVCKRWLYLISYDSYFIQLHSDQQSKSNKPPLLLQSTLFGPRRPRRSTMSVVLSSTDMKGNDDSSSSVTSTFEVKKLEYDYPCLLPTCFDLVCIHDYWNNICICNPSTHESIKLPSPPAFSGNSILGFGYVQSTDEYKLVHMIPPNHMAFFDYGVDIASILLECHVFTLGKGKGKGKGGSAAATTTTTTSWAWRDLENPPYFVNYSAPASVKGAIHWLVFYIDFLDAEYYHGHMIDPRNTIVAFDVESEEFRLVSHPEGCPDIRSSNFPFEFQLVELRGLLCLSHLKQVCQMDIWMLKDYESGIWVKEYSIDISSYIRGEGDFHYYAPRDLLQEQIKVLMIQIPYIEHSSMITRYFVGGCDIGVNQNQYFSFYVESLRSLKQLQGKALETETETETETEVEEANAENQL